MFNKWILIEEAKPMICESFNVMWGYSQTRKVLVEVYRKKKFDGTYKYKNVIREA